MSNLVPVRAWITRVQHDRLVAHSLATGRPLSVILAARAMSEPTPEMLIREVELMADLEARKRAGNSVGGSRGKGKPRPSTHKGRELPRVKSDPGKK